MYPRILMIYFCLVIFNGYSKAQVGIGTQQPTASLHVEDDSTATEIKISHPNQSVLSLNANSPVIRWNVNNSTKAYAGWISGQFKIFSSPPVGNPFPLPYPTLNLSEERKVGINMGTFGAPQEALHINGRLKLGYNDDPATEGTIRYNTDIAAFEGHDGNQWFSFQGGLVDRDKDTKIKLLEDSRDAIQFISGIADTMTYNGEVIEMPGTNMVIGGNVGFLTTPSNQDNTFLGREVGLGHGRGSNNVYIGSRAGAGPFQGVSNTYIGAMAGNGSASGNFGNIALGYGSGAMATGNNNIFMGYNVGNNSVGDGNILIGRDLGQDLEANNRLLIGDGSANLPLIDGDFQSGSLDINGSFNVKGNTYIEGILEGALGANFNGNVSGTKGNFSDEVTTDSIEINGFWITTQGNELKIKRNNNDLLRISSNGKVYVPDLGGNGASFVKVLSSGELYTSNHPQTVQISPYQFSPTTVHLNDIFQDMRISRLTELKLWHIPNSVQNSITIYRMSKDPTQFFEEQVMRLVIPSNNTNVLQVYSTNAIITPGSDIIDTIDYFYFMEATNTVIRHISQMEISGN